MNNVVLVDDDKCILNGLSKIIPWGDYDCRITALFSDAGAVLNYCKNNPVSIVISDIKMPGMLGTELAGELKLLNPNIITILLTAYENFEYAREAVNNQVFRYLIKPVDTDELIEAITAATETIKQIRTLDNEHTELITFKKYQKCRNFLISLYESGTVPAADEDTEWLFCGGKLRAYSLFIALNEKRDTRQETDFSRDYDDSFYHFSSNNAEISILIDNEENSQECFSEVQKNYLLSGIPAICSTGINSLSTLKPDCEKLTQYLESKRYLNRNYINSLPVPPQKLLINHIDDLGNIRKEAKILSDGLLKGDFARVQNSINVIDQLLNNTLHAISPQIVKTCLVSALDTACSYYKDYLPSHAESIECVSRCIENITAYSDFCQDTDYILNLAHELYSKEFLSEDSSIQVINMVKQFINESLDKEINVSDIAEYVHMSSAYVSALFKKATGEKLWSYVTRVRMEKAHDYLVNTDLPINRIASICGYQSLNTFYYCFKQFYGITPKHLRQDKEENNRQ